MAVSSESTLYLTCAETAQEVRKMLKAQFPGVRFSVRSRTYAGGASIDVRYGDGPSVPQVDAAIEGFRGADFDGMIDLKTYRKALVAMPSGEVREVRYGADFIHVQRDFEAAPRAVAIGVAWVEREYGVKWDGGYEQRWPCGGMVGDTWRVFEAVRRFAYRADSR